jgi:hypothetical protein
LDGAFKVCEAVCVIVFCFGWAAVSSLAGGINGTNAAYADASGTSAGFNYPTGVAIDTNGNVFVADMANNCVRQVTVGGGTRIGAVAAHARQTVCSHFMSEFLAALIVSRSINASFVCVFTCYIPPFFSLFFLFFLPLFCASTLCL